MEKGGCIAPEAERPLVRGNRLRTSVKGTITVCVEDPAGRPPPAARRVVVEKAKGLRNTDAFGKSDPFCKVLWNGAEVGRTVTVDDELHPVFPEHKSNGFEIFAGNGPRGGWLQFEVFDEDPGNDELLGTASLRLGGLDEKGKLRHKDGLCETVELQIDQGARFKHFNARLWVRIERPAARRRIWIKSGHELLQTDALGKSDPFVRAYWCNDPLGRTKVIDNTALIL